MRGVVVLGRLLPFMLAFLRDRRRFILFGRGVTAVGCAPSAARRAAHPNAAELGPTFIKLAQVLAARADILPEPYLAAIGTLTDQVPPLAPGVAERVIAEELGREAGDVFEHFDSVPLAAASAGAGAPGPLRGQDVVVKILRPGVDELVRQDLAVAFELLFVLNVLFPSHHVRALSAIVNEFANGSGRSSIFTRRPGTPTCSGELRAGNRAWWCLAWSRR